jgi:hypothetical protein
MISPFFVGFITLIITLLVIALIFVTYHPTGLGTYVKFTETPCNPKTNQQEIIFQCVVNPKTGLPCSNGDALTFANKVETRECNTLSNASQFVVISQTDCTPLPDMINQGTITQTLECQSMGGSRNQCTNVEIIQTMTGPVNTVVQYQIGETITKEIPCTITF